jgi:hypothetical protein
MRFTHGITHPPGLPDHALVGRAHSGRHGRQHHAVGHAGVVKQWELWQGSDGSHDFFASDNESAREFAPHHGMTLTWTTWAEGGNAAMQALYDHLGWGTYKPVLRPDGTPYPEDELDSEAT